MKVWVNSLALMVLAMPAFVAAPGADPAQNYPNRPLRMITGSPGSTSDIAARFVAQKLTQLWHQQVVVDNRPGAGGRTSSQLSGELFNQITGAKLVHIPYKGAGFALSGVVAGEVQAAFLSTTTASAQVKAGKLRALAVLSPKRFAAAPDIPTAAEQGYPGIDASVWFGLFAPAGSPKAIISKINHDVVSSLQSPEAVRVLAAQGAEAVSTTPEEFAAFLKSGIAKWGKVIKEAGIKAN